MTSRNRRVRNPVRRTFSVGVGTGGTIDTAIVDITPVSELSATADSQFGDLLVTGIALIDASDEMAVGQIMVWTGRTSTEPSQADRGVRTRQFAYQAVGLPFVFRFRGLRVDPGMQMKLISNFRVETLATLTYQHIVHVKWSFRELAQG